MLSFNFNPFPQLETERLVLRQVTMRHAKDLFPLRSDPEVMKYICKPLAQDISEVKSLINRIQIGIRKNQSIAWGISMKGETKIMGTIGFHFIDSEHHRAEIGYMLGKPFWNKGFLSEAMPCVIKYGFDVMKLHSIEAKIDTDNTFSKRLLLNNKFLKEAYFKGNYFFNEQFLDTEVFSLIKS